MWVVVISGGIMGVSCFIEFVKNFLLLQMVLSLKGHKNRTDS
jgi:hypothetical protein